MSSPRLKCVEKQVLKLVRPIAIVDLETTGTSQATDRIVEIAILKVMPDGAMLHLRKRVNPGIRIPREATGVHGITNEDVADKPRFKAVASEVASFLRNCDLAGFNLKNFDLPMLQAEFDSAGEEFSFDDRRIIDVKEIYHFHEGRTLSDAVRFYCGSDHGEAHSALADARATWRVLGAQIERYGLPHSVRKLSEFMESASPSRYLDSGRWFTTRDGRAAFARGKYGGVSLSKVFREDPEYLDWILGLPAIPKDTANMIREKIRAESAGGTEPKANG
jgi:DNA polymerase-3 subunit epsilon